MRNHENRSCAVAHRTLYAVQMASAKIDDLAAEYVAFERRLQDVEAEEQQREITSSMLMLAHIGSYRFRDQWPGAVGLARQPAACQMAERGRV